MLVRRKRTLRSIFFCGLIALSGVLAAKEDEAPDMAFLEYLGSWDESDEDWLLLNNSEDTTGADEKEGRSDPVLQGEASTESENEH